MANANCHHSWINKKKGNLALAGKRISESEKKLEKIIDYDY